MSIASRLLRRFSVEISTKNIYLEYIPDIRKLDHYNQDRILHQTYANGLASILVFSYDEFRELSLDPTRLSSKFVLIKERKFNTIIGFSFFQVYEMFYLENNASNENRFVTSLHFYLSLLPHLRKNNLGLTTFRTAEMLMKKEFPDSNRASFNITLNPGAYQLRSNLTPLVYPGPKKMPNDEIPKLMQKYIRDLGHVTVSDEHPFIRISPGAHLVGTNREKYLKNIENVPEATRFFYQATGLKDEWTLLNLSIFNLIKGNTLNLEPREYASLGSVEYDVVEYGINKKIDL